MSLIEGGRITDAAWLKVISLLLSGCILLGSACIGLGVYFANSALEKLEDVDRGLDAVGSIVVKHEAEIAYMKEEIRLLRAAPQGELRFRGRAGGPKRDIPRPPKDPPTLPDPPRAPAPPEKREKNDPPEQELLPEEQG